MSKTRAILLALSYLPRPEAIHLLRDSAKDIDGFLFFMNTHLSHGAATEKQALEAVVLKVGERNRGEVESLARRLDIYYAPPWSKTQEPREVSDDYSRA